MPGDIGQSQPYPTVPLHHVTGPLGTRDSFFMDHPNEIVHIPPYFPYHGILVCNLD